MKIFYSILLFVCVFLVHTLSYAAATIVGTVTDSVTGLPIQGALVNALKGNQVRYTTTTASDGTYSLTNIQPSNYTLIISANGYQTQTIGVKPQNNQTTTVNISLIPNGGTISGTITDAATTFVIAGASVSIFQGTTLITTAVTNGSGMYTAPNLAPGNYTVVATATAFDAQAKGAQVQAATTTIVNFALLAPPGTIAGTITDALTTNPIPDAFVEVFDGNTLISFADTALNGTYTIANLAPGNYTVVVSATDYQTSTIGAIVRAGLTTTVNLALNQNPGEITGSVINAINGAGIPSATVAVFQNFTFITAVLTDLLGEYTIPDLAPGNYILIATAPHFGNVARGAQVTANNSTIVNFALLPDRGTLAGTVTDATTTDPLAGATIRIFDQEVLITSVQTDPNGNYNITNLAPGNYTVVATAKNYQGKASEATVTANTTSIINFSLNAHPGALAGTVTDAATTNPLANATVAAFQGSTFIDFVLTDINGDYTIPNLTPESYFIVALATNYQATFSPENIAPNSTTIADFALNSSPGSISGIITEGCRGNALGGAIVVATDNQVVIGFDVSDDNGMYTITNLAPGTYVITTFQPRFLTRSVNAIVASNTTTSLNITLLPLALPPSNLSGSLLYNRYLTQTDPVHKLTWTASNGLCTTGYFIYRNGKQIAFVSASQKLKYVDYRYNKKAAVYSVIATNSFGQNSSPVSINFI